MGTSNAVFFYIAPFTYPDTRCGLLFASSLESSSRDAGIATPFDSGGLIRIFARPNEEPAPEFLARHELPIPEHRRLLSLSIELLFKKPRDYCEGTDPVWPGPIGLTRGDHRRWTHEVRIPGSVFIRGGHLQAVFATTAQVSSDPSVRGLFEWCERERVDNITFSAPKGKDFEALRRECLGYIRGRLY